MGKQWFKTMNVHMYLSAMTVAEFSPQLWQLQGNSVLACHQSGYGFDLTLARNRKRKEKLSLASRLTQFKLRTRKKVLFKESSLCDI